MGAWGELEAALRDRGTRPLLEEPRRTVGARELRDAVGILQDEMRRPELALEAGDVLALRGRHPALEVAAPLAAWSLGLCAQVLSRREPGSSIQGLVQGAGARAVLAFGEGAFQWLPRPETPRRAPLPAGTLLATSGSSGRPKLVLHALEQHVAAARGAIGALDVRPDDRLLLSLPTWHVGGLALVLRAVLGQAVLCLPGPDEALAAALVRLAPTHVSLVATQLRRLLAAPAARAALAACRAVLLGGGPVPAPLRAEALAAGVPLAVGYGATETTAFVTLARAADEVRREACAGRPLPGRVVRVDDAGEIRVGGPTLCTGILGPEGLTDVRGPDGLWASGDLGVLRDGLLHVSGRRDRMFVSGGENVQPEEVEAALLAVPGVEEAVVVPVAHAEYGLRPVAFLAGRDLEAAPLEAALREVLPGFKVPDAFYRLPAPAEGRLKAEPRRLASLAADPLARARLEAI
jgi:O-succinylbenzoic acid--CoA ligase